MNEAVPARILGRGGIGGIRVSRHARRFLVVAGILVVASILVARFSTVAFIAVGVLLLLSLAYASWHWPRAALMTVALVPLVDRYFVALWVPGDLRLITQFFSEGLLFLVGLTIAARAVRDGTFWPAIRHPVTIALVAFVLVGFVSAVLNGVSLVVAAAGIAFTVDAMALFFLPRMVTWRPRHLWLFAAIFVAFATVSGLLALGQVVLAPNILGLASSSGRFGEGERVGSFFAGNPNILGAMLAIAIPFCTFGAVRLPGRRLRIAAVAIAFVLFLALLFTFSRGAWFSLAASLLVVGVLLDRRALLLGVVLGAVAFGSAHVIPRNVLAHLSGTAVPQEDFGFLDSTFDRFNTIGSGNDLRVQFIWQGLPLLAETPIVGVGPGRYGGAVAQQYGSPLYDRLGNEAPERTVDNFWLHLLVEFGVLGAVMYIAIYVAAGLDVLRRAWRHPGTRVVLLAGALAAAGTLAIDSLTEMIFEGNTFSFTAWFLLGAATAAGWAPRMRRRPGETA